MRKKDIFEKVLGRELRRAGLGYEDYIRIISDIRDLSKKQKVDLVKAAEAILSQEK
jgi:hypothetical protein